MAQSPELDAHDMSAPQKKKRKLLKHKSIVNIYDNTNNYN